MLTKPHTALGLFALVLAVSLCGVGRTAHAATQVRVTADRVNLRARPDSTSEVVSQVDSGAILTVEEEGEGWLGIAPPDDTDLWVYGELVKAGVVTVAKLQVRAGPGINYKPVGMVNAGDRLVERGQRAGWLRIAPPSGCRLWVSSDYVKGLGKADAAVKSAPVETGTPPAPQATVSAPAAPPPSTWLRHASPSTPEVAPRLVDESLSRPAPPPDALKLVASRSQGKQVQMRGVVGPAGGPLWRRPSSYRLVQSDSAGQPVTACYLTGDDSRLGSLVGRIVVVSGREYRVQGVRQPVVAVDAVRADDR